MLSLRGHIDYGGGRARDVGVTEEDAFCPHCGGPLRRRPALFCHPCFDDAGERIAGKKLSPAAWLVLTALRAAFGQFVGRDYLLARLRPKKGEEAEPKLVDVYLCHLRKALEPTPFMIEVRKGTGRWRLTWRHPAGNETP